MLTFLLPCLIAAAPKPPDLAATAERIVGEVLGVKEKEVVAITADPADQALVEELVVALGKKGASPLVRMGWATLRKRWLVGVPAANDGAQLALEEKLLPIIDAEIVIERPDEPGLMNDVGEARIAAHAKVFSGLSEKQRKRKTRIIGLGNGLAPGKTSAKEHGLTEAELATIFWAGIGTDYAALTARGEAVKAAFASAKEVVVATPTGTKLTFKLAPKPMIVSDGVITAEDMKAGGAALLTWLPAGEVYGLVEAGTGEGTVVVPRYMFRGEEVKDFTVTFKAGKVTGLTAKPSKAFELLKQSYEAAGAGKDALAGLDLGINADVKAPKGKALQTWVPAGAVTISVGADEWMGGTNTVQYGFVFHLTDATVVVDGTAVVEKGALKVGAK